MNKEEREQELIEACGKIKESKRGFVLSMIKDFVFLEEQIETLRKYPRYIIDPKNPNKQVKLPCHEMLKDYQAQKNDITTKIAKILDAEVGEVSPLVKALMRFEDGEND